MEVASGIHNVQYIIPNTHYIPIFAIMNRLLIIIIILFANLQIQAQFIRADYKKAGIMYHRPVIVPMLDLSLAENECDLAQMHWYNNNIKALMKEHWRLNDSIITMDEKRLTSIIGSKSPEYAIFLAIPSREGQQSSSDIFWYRSFTFMLFLSEDGMRMDPDMVDRASPLIPNTDNSGQLLRGRYIFKLSMANFHLSVNDLVFVISQFNNKVEESLEKRYSKKGLYGEKVAEVLTSTLKSKTLLIPDNLYAEGIDETRIANVYKHPFRICTQEEITSLINERKENTAYIHYFWSDQERMFLGGIVDAQSGDVLAMLKPRSVRLEHSDCLMPGSSYRSLIRIKPDQLKKLSRNIK